MTANTVFAHHGERPTLRQIKQSWPAVIDVTQLALALGISRSSAYELIRTGTCPVKTITVGRRVKALTASLIEVLEGNGAAGH